MADKVNMETLTLAELADLLCSYTFTNTTRKGPERPSGNELKAFLQRKLRSNVGPERIKENRSPERVLLDLQHYHEETTTNLLHELEAALIPYVHSHDKSVRRKPKEIAREVILGLMENNLYGPKGFPTRLILMIHEGKYVPEETQLVRARGIDWVVYSKITIPFKGPEKPVATTRKAKVVKTKEKAE